MCTRAEKVGDCHGSAACHKNTYLVLIGILQLAVGLPDGADAERSVFSREHEAQLRQPLEVRRSRAAGLDHSLHHVSARRATMKR